MKKQKPLCEQSSILSRYTTLPVLLDIIERSSLTLLSPEAWPDRNDREIMQDYKRKRKLCCLLATCFSRGEETVHHWNAFADGLAGCRIDFHLSVLIEAANQNGCRHGKVIYRKINKIRELDLSDKQRPTSCPHCSSANTIKKSKAGKWEFIACEERFDGRLSQSSLAPNPSGPKSEGPNGRKSKGCPLSTISKAETH